MAVEFHPYNPSEVALWRANGVDAYGNPPERSISDGGGMPCRHCLRDISAGEEMLILAACPFPEKQPYAETGPIFLCASDCAPYEQLRNLPPILASRPRVLLKGYNSAHRIIYGSGQITAQNEIISYCETLFQDDNVTFIDARSALNNCFTLRITRAREQI